MKAILKLSLMLLLSRSLTTHATLAEQIEKALNTPITFYGRVVDESNQPVAGADVYFTAADKFDGPGSNYQRKSDINGLFFITGIHGADLGVGVGKEGYYSRDHSHAYFNYGNGPHGKNLPPPTRDNPAVFVLVKMGNTEPLIKISSRQYELPKDGTPIFIDFATGKSGVTNTDGLQVESWLGDTTKRKFNWTFRWSIPHGGLIKRTNEFAFEAPADGYQPFMYASMTTNVDRWLSGTNGQYFARLSSGAYARFAISLYPGKYNFIVLESYLNPAIGHRNLEFDPKKEIKTPK